LLFILLRKKRFQFLIYALHTTVDKIRSNLIYLSADLVPKAKIFISRRAITICPSGIPKSLVFIDITWRLAVVTLDELLEHIVSRVSRINDPVFDANVSGDFHDSSSRRSSNVSKIVSVVAIAIGSRIIGVESASLYDRYWHSSNFMLDMKE
jgi:hypothetical protein